MDEKEIKKYILKEARKRDTEILGIIYFGSRVKFQDVPENSDYDIGIVYRGKLPEFPVPDRWDLFLWSEKKWLRGFALQVELARYAKILYDPRRVVRNRFAMIKEKILPHWLAYLKNF